VSAGRSARPPAPRVPWQFVLRATAVVAGLTLLLVVEVHGFVFFLAWGLIVLALVTEGIATLVYWLRSRASP
jgi:hypothetical protein